MNNTAKENKKSYELPEKRKYYLFLLMQSIIEHISPPNELILNSFGEMSCYRCNRYFLGGSYYYYYIDITQLNDESLNRFTFN